MKALARIGIDRNEARRRGLNLHAWRHFFNTTLFGANIAAAKVQAVIGHKTPKETDRYTDFDTTRFAEVQNIQTTLFHPAAKKVTVAEPEPAIAQA